MKYKISGFQAGPSPNRLKSKIPKPVNSNFFGVYKARLKPGKL